MKNVKTFLTVCCASLLSIYCGRRQAAPEHSQGHAPEMANVPLTTDEVIARLKSGNQTFLKEISSRNYNHGESYNYLDQIEHSKNDQHPMAFILSCMDSRVPPEIIFDEGIGELFVDRVAGNVEDEYILGSMEYAVNVKGVKVIVVLGHRNCGAIHAAFGQVDSANEDLVPLIADVKEGVIPDDSEPYDRSAKHNVAKTIADILNKSKIIHSKVQAHEVVIVGALYDVTNGTVDWDSAKW